MILPRQAARRNTQMCQIQGDSQSIWKRKNSLKFLRIWRHYEGKNRTEVAKRIEFLLNILRMWCKIKIQTVNMSIGFAAFTLPIHEGGCLHLRIQILDERFIMEEKGKGAFAGLKAAAQKGLASIDVEAIKDKAAEATGTLLTKAEEVKDAAVAVKDDIADKLTELDRMLQESVTEYNDAYTIMNDKGVQLFVERSRSIDTIVFVEVLVNSIANRPKSFDTEFEEIRTNRRKFTDSCEFANRELTEARKAATGAGAGLAAGASVAFMAPTAAMWIATTFGTASTGAAISTLSGAAATNAALAWLGGGAIAAGGGGMTAGNAFLALAGPVGWTIVGATLLSSILIFTAKKTKLNKQKNEEILAIKQNTELVHEMDAQIGTILSETSEVRNKLNEMYLKAVSLFGTDYLSLNNEQKYLLGALVNNTKALAALFGKMIGVEDGEESE